MVGALFSCDRAEPLRIISDDINEATYSYAFEDLEQEASALLSDYIEAYTHTLDPTEYACGDTYKLDRFHLALVVHDEANGNVPAVFLFHPAGSPLSSNGEAVPTVAAAADGAAWYRQRDRRATQRMLSALQTPRSRFAPYTENGIDYLVIRFDREALRSLDRANRTRWTAFFVHEGFHLFAQRNMPRPNRRHSGIRRSIPVDYPADPESFSLIAAGIQLNENTLYASEPVDWEQTLALQYVLWDRLRNADTTGLEYVDGFYLFYAWLEGGAEFIDQKITRGAGIYSFANSDTRAQVAYSTFVSNVEQTVLTGNSTVITNGEEREARYAAVLRGSYYQLGALTFRILEGLGEDPLAQMARGRNPYQLLDDYLRANDLTIDEDVALADLKSLINWNNSLALMEDYIAVFD